VGFGGLLWPTAQVLKDFLPVDATSMRHHSRTMHSRWPNAVKTNWARSMGLCRGCPLIGPHSPSPDGPMTSGLMGLYPQLEEKQQHFEVIVGKSILVFSGTTRRISRPASGFGVCPDLDESPNAACSKSCQSQGHQRVNTHVSVRWWDTVRDLPALLNPHAEHLLDWFHSRCA